MRAPTRSTISRRTTPPLSPPEIARVSWRRLGPAFIKAWGYPNGKFMPEHLEILGPNGSGKTYFQDQVLMMRAAARGSQIVMLSTKPDDKTLKGLRYPDGKPWKTITKWPPPYGVDQMIYAARATGLGAAERAKQHKSIEELLNAIWVPNSNRILAIDEVGYVEQELKFRTHINTMFREARALGLTLVTNTQRPVGTSRYMHSESLWKVAFRPFDERDAETVAEIMGAKRMWIPILMELNRHNYEFVMQHAPTGRVYISHIE